MTDEKSLTEGILSHDKRALFQFYRTYAPKLSRYIEGKVHNPKDAEEILQDTLFHFLESLRDFQGRSHVQTYLYAICNHKIIDFYRKKKFRHTVFSQIPQLEALVMELTTPEDQLDAVLLKEKIIRAFEKLVPQYRTLLQSKYMDGLRIDEIAKNFATTAKSIESRLFRARKAFVKAFISL
jgi:RNA polymerase sigma-70 factor (ECF subfamily)